MSIPCDSPDRTQLRRAVEQFNSGEYYACHETLEELWLCENEPERNLYKGILQVAVGLYHKDQDNLRGAIRLLASGAELLEPFLPMYAGLDLGRLHAEALALRDALESGTDPGPTSPPPKHIHIKIINNSVLKK